MRIMIKDFFRAYYAEPFSEMPSVERVKVLTMKKIQNTAETKKRMPRIVSIAAILAVVLATAAVGLAVSWHFGFISTAGMSEQQINALLERAELGAYEVTDEAGYIHFFDSDGKEVMVLSSEEFQRYEQAKEESNRRQIQDAAGHLVNADSISLMPRSITPIATDASGAFGDFLLANGDMVILHGEGEDGYVLKKGDTVTVSVEATGPCYVSFGVVLEKEMLNETTTKAQNHQFVYTAEKDGLYCFTLRYYSSDADNFTNGSIQING